MGRSPLPGECNACYLFACHHCELPNRCVCSKCHPSTMAELVAKPSRHRMLRGAGLIEAGKSG